MSQLPILVFGSDAIMVHGAAATRDRLRQEALLNACWIAKIIATAVALTSCSTSAMDRPKGGTASSPAAAQLTPLGQLEIAAETLPSGLRVVLAKTPPVQGQEPRVYVGSYIFHGVMQEERLGWAHLMEHVAANNRSAIPGPAVPEGVEAFNGNALARPYYTSFVLIAPPAMLPAVVHGRMARVGKMQDDPAIFTRELGRLVAELERDASSQYSAYSALVALARGERAGVAEELQSVQAASQPAVRTMMEKHYRPENAALVVVGDIDVNEARAAVLTAAAKLGWNARLSPEPLQGPSLPRLLTGKAAVVSNQNKGDHTIVGIGWPKPRTGARDQVALLVADQLLLGGRDDPRNPKRSDASPLGRRLSERLRASALWDRVDNWATPPLAETGPALQAIIFNTDMNPAPSEVDQTLRQALSEIRRTEMSDAAIEAAKEKLARFYEGWLFEPDYRILGDHLIAYYASGLDPRGVTDIPTAIRQVRAGAVRAALDRHLREVRPLVVVLPKSADPQPKPEG